jgi:hypothetical protein
MISVAMMSVTLALAGTFIGMRCTMSFTKKSRCFLDVAKIGMKKIDMKKLKKNMAVLEKKIAEKMMEQAERKLATSKWVIENAVNAVNPLNRENNEEMECLEGLVNNV